MKKLIMKNFRDEQNIKSHLENKSKVKRGDNTINDMKVWDSMACGGKIRKRREVLSKGEAWEMRMELLKKDILASYSGTVC